MMGINAGAVIASLQMNTSQFDAALKKVSADMNKMKLTFSGLGNVVKRMGATLASAMGGIVRAVSDMVRSAIRWIRRGAIALAAYLGASLKAFASFEDAMVRSAAVTAKATYMMRKEMSRTALEMSKQSILSAKELAEGYFALGQAGFSAAQSIKALPVVQDFAIASQVKLDVSTRYLVRTLEGLGMASVNPVKNMQQMERVSNAFTFAAIKTTAEIRDFAVAMTHAAAPALRLVNKSMEEGTAVLMAFARAGIVAEEAGTLLWTTVRDLQRANLKAREEWEKLDIKVYDMRGNMRNLADIFGDLENKFAGMSDESKKAALQMLGFQDRSLRGVQALMGFSDQMKDFEKEMKGLTKLTREIAEKYMKSFSAAMKMLWHQVVDISIAVGQRLAPTIRGLADDFGGSQRNIKEWAVGVAGYIANALEELRRFVRYIKYDMEGAIQLGLNTIKTAFKAFGVSLMLIMEEIFVALGANIVVWIQRGLAKRLELNKVSSQILNEMMGMDSNWERYYKLLIGDKSDFEKYAKQVSESQEKAKELLATGYFKPVMEEAFPTIPIEFDVLEDSLRKQFKEAGIDIKKYVKESTFSEFTKTEPERMKKLERAISDIKRGFLKGFDTIKAGLAPAANMLVDFKDELVGIYKGMKKPEFKVVDRTQIQDMERALRRIYDLYSLQSNILDEHVEKRERILKMMPILAQYEQAYGEYADATNTVMWDDRIVAQFNEEMEKHDEILRQINERQRSYVAFSDQMQNWVIDATNLWENFGQVATGVLDSLADTLGNLLARGRADWKAWAATALEEINKVILRAMIARVVTQFFPGFDMGMQNLAPNFSTSVSNAGIAPAPSILSGNRFGGMQQGAVIPNPSFLVTGQNKGSYVAEVGPEAVLPLSRSKTGELGVRAEQPNVTVEPKIKINNIFDREEQYAAMQSERGEKIIMNILRRLGVG